MSTYKILYLLDKALQVAIMRKEFLILETKTTEQRNNLITHFKEAIEFSSSCKLSLLLSLHSLSKIYSQYLRRLSNRRRLSRISLLGSTQVPDHRALLGVRLLETGQVGA